MKARRTFYRIICALLTVLIAALTLSPCMAVDTYAREGDASLPYSETLSLSGSESGEAWVEFSCERLSIVTLSARSLTEGAFPELSVYTDDATLIDTAASEDGTVAIQILPAYTGTHRVLVKYRGAGVPTAEISLDIRAYDGYKKNRLETLPHSSEYTKKSHKAADAEDVCGHLTDSAEGYTLSIFSIPHSAGGILSYRIIAPEGDARATLYTYGGDLYESHPSHSGEGYTAGDAREAAYSEDSYLLIYSRGEFSLEAELLERREYVPTPISLPYSGRLDVSGGEATYDGEAFARLLARFPYSDIENPYVRLYEISTDTASVVSLLCEKREHAGFSFVSAEHGLSASSKYPLREFGSYCSETHPTELCYGSVLCDSGVLYLVYTGSADSAYVEISAAPSHQSQTEYQEEYNKNDVIPRAMLGSVYSDTHVFERLGVDPIDVGITRITGYRIESEDGTRYYFGCADEITPPYKRGECRLWVTLKSVGTDGTGAEVSYERRLLLCTFSTTGVIIIPTVEEMIESIKNGEPISLVYILLMLMPIAAMTAIGVLIFRKVKRKRAADNGNAPETPVASEIREKEGEETCSESSDQEENVSSKR